jgi:hypothetical protein
LVGQHRIGFPSHLALYDRFHQLAGAPQGLRSNARFLAFTEAFFNRDPSVDCYPLPNHNCNTYYFSLGVCQGEFEKEVSEPSAASINDMPIALLSIQAKCKGSSPQLSARFLGTIKLLDNPVESVTEFSTHTTECNP